MARDLDKEPYLAPSADGPDQIRRKSHAGKGIIIAIACFGLVVFALYASILIYAGIKAS